MAEGTENTGSKKKLILIIAVVVVLLLGGAGGAWFMFGGDSADAEVAQPVAQPAKAGEAYYVLLPQPFTFNVTGDKRDRLVQVKAHLMVRGDTNDSIARQHIPLIESTLLQAFSTATAEQLRTPNGRDELQKLALSAVQDAMVKVSGQQVVARVLFTGFVMQ